ncbi:MAG TPA: hypothetical protein VGF10_10460, partial [Gaiella sp.]
GLPFWPLDALFGHVRAWNLFLLLSYLAAGGFAYLWLRELALPVAAAAFGGLVFALEPYRVAQSAGHLRGPVSVLLPLALWALERGRRGSPWWYAGAAAALASIPFSDVHLALGASPFFLLYALCRRAWAGSLAVVPAVLAGVVVGHFSTSGIGSGGRSLREVARYSASGLDLVTRHPRHGLESFVFLGWLTPLLALAGLVALRRRRGLAVLLGLAAVVPCLLALGGNLPGYEAVWRAVPGLESTRVPERLMPIACLAIAALAAFGVDAALTTLGVNHHRLVAPAVVAAVVVVLALDLRVPVFGAVAADEPNAAYAAIRGDGRLLELPVFRPDLHYGSVYLGYARQSPRERPQGYSTLAPPAAERLARELRGLSCGRGEIPAGLGIRFVAVHRGLYEQSGFFGPGCADRAEAMLRADGWRLLARDGRIATYAR